MEYFEARWRKQINDLPLPRLKKKKKTSRIIKSDLDLLFSVVFFPLYYCPIV